MLGDGLFKDKAYFNFKKNNAKVQWFIDVDLMNELTVVNLTEVLLMNADKN